MLNVRILTSVSCALLGLQKYQAAYLYLHTHVLLRYYALFLLVLTCLRSWKSSECHDVACLGEVESPKSGRDAGLSPEKNG